MKLALIGFGQAGGKIVDRFVHYNATRNTGFIEAAIAVNSARADLMGLENIPEENQVLIGRSRVKGHGVGADNELGASIASDGIEEIQGAIDNVATHKVDAFLIVAGLGGGTGSGGSPVIAEHLKKVYREPVYGLGILPSSDEGGVYSLNAARSFKTFVDEVDNLMVFDNDGWKNTGESVQSGYNNINREIMSRFGPLFSAGEIDALDGNVAESVVDASEIINTLDCGGLTSIGYASEEIEGVKKNKGLLSSFRQTDDEVDTVDATNRITTLVRKAALGRLTLNCNIESTQRALVLVSGPPKYLNRKGIEDGRRWVEDNTDCLEVRGGDYPIENAEKIGVTVVLSGITDADRVREMQATAVEAKKSKGSIEEESSDALDDLVNNEDDELDSLF